MEEGDIVVNKISELRKKKQYAYADFAILYRTNAQSRIFEEALRKRGIPIVSMAVCHFINVKKSKM